MSRFIVRRFIASLLVLFGVSLLVFLTMRLSGDPVQLLLRDGNPTEEDIERLRAALKLDRPLTEQYLSFVASAVQGDFGESLRYRTPALEEVLSRMPATIQLSVAAYLFALLLAIPTGIISATRRGGMADFFSRLIALIGVSFPSFWLGLILILLFAVRLRWLPVSGRGDGPVEGAKALILPAITLGTAYSATLMRLLRSSLLEALSQDYVRTARAKGLHSRTVLAQHVLRNALIPVITVAGLQIGFLLSGSVVVEVVFSWPGVGRLVVDSIGARDYPIVQAAVVLLAALLILINLAVDIIIAVIDPRIRYSS
jgi:peptide/nickel transport system permease protein